MEQQRYFLYLVVLTLSVVGESMQKSTGSNDPTKYANIKGTPLSTYYEEFEAWHIKFNRPYTYPSDEYTKRYQIFAENMKKIKLLNENDRGTATYGATDFADLSEEEFKRYHTGFKPSHEIVNMTKAKIPTAKAPVSFDWRDHGAVTAVKDQGHCGSCWSFSVTGNIEGQLQISKGQLISLSEQALLDCDTENYGCEGGLIDVAYEEIMKIGGVMSEDDYPYKGVVGTCKFDHRRIQTTISDWVMISQDETEMVSWLAANGPTSVALNADDLQLYTGGIWSPRHCPRDLEDLNHAVLLVGYGDEDNMPYWIVKNSWGPDSGENGYFRMFRGDGLCGVNQEVTSAVVP